MGAGSGPLPHSEAIPMKIKMVVSVAGADFALSPGDVTERFDASEAIRLIEAGYAVPAGESAPETAVEPPPAETREEGESDPEPEPEPEPQAEEEPEDEKAALVAEAEALGIDVDGRWGVARLKAEIAKAKA